MAAVTYVKGAIRKDAVAITPKECRVTEARVLESLYAGGWVPTQLRSVDVEEVPSPTDELARLEALYGVDTVKEAYGHPAEARKAIAAILAMSPAQVKDSGLLVENEATPIVVAPAPKKGGRAAASVDSGGESAPAAS